MNKWLGHSGKVAEKHYLQVTDEHWRKASVLPAPTVAPIEHNLEPSGPSLETTKPSELLGSDGLCGGSDTLMSDPDGSRTRVTAVKGQCPRPLDDGAAMSAGYALKRGESVRDS